MSGARWQDAVLQTVTQLIWGMVGAVLVLSGYHVTLGSKDKVTLATVNLVKIIQEQREQGVREAQQRGSADDDMLMKQLAAFGTQLEAVARDEAAARGMILIQSQTVIAGQLPDVTEAVRQRLKTGAVR